MNTNIENNPAEEFLCDRLHFTLDEKSFEAFNDLLYFPLSANKAVQQLLQKKSPWDEQV